jgi:predicted nucleic-acid-binding protein
VIALDTNVLVRFLTGDDPVESPLAAGLMASLTPDAPGYLCREVVLETVWVLERTYRYSRADVALAIEGLLAAPELAIETADDIGAALQTYAQANVGFADLMIASATRRAGADRLLTFDRWAVSLPGVDLLRG